MGCSQSNSGRADGSTRENRQNDSSNSGEICIPEKIVDDLDVEFSGIEISSAAAALRKKGIGLFNDCFGKNTWLAPMVKVDRAKDAIKTFTDASKLARDQQDPSEWLSSTKNKGITSFRLAGYDEFRKRNTEKMILFYYQMSMEALSEAFYHSSGMKDQSWIDNICSNLYAVTNVATTFVFGLDENWQKRYSLLEGLIPIRDKKNALVTSLIYIAIANEILKVIEHADDANDWKQSLRLIGDIYRPFELAKSAQSMLVQDSPTASRIKNDIFFVEMSKNKFQTHAEYLQRRAANEAEKAAEESYNQKMGIVNKGSHLSPAPTASPAPNALVSANPERAVVKPLSDDSAAAADRSSNELVVSGGGGRELVPVDCKSLQVVAVDGGCNDLVPMGNLDQERWYGGELEEYKPAHQQREGTVSVRASEEAVTTSLGGVDDDEEDDSVWRPSEGASVNKKPQIKLDPSTVHMGAINLAPTIGRVLTGITLDFGISGSSVGGQEVVTKEETHHI